MSLTVKRSHSVSLIRPVSKSCIMPCFTAFIFSRFCSNNDMSESITERT